MKKLFAISIVLVIILLMNFSIISEAFEHNPKPPPKKEEKPISHKQPKLTAAKEFSVGGLSSEYKGTVELAVNFYQNPKLTTKNYVLNDNDKVCVGDTISASDTKLSGEWFSKGGNFDSPPISWVTEEQMQNIINAVMAQPAGGETISKSYGETISKSYGDTIESDIGILRDMKIPLYRSELFVYGWLTYTGKYTGLYTYGTLICVPNSKIVTAENKDTYEVTKEGYVTFEIRSSPECIFYLESVVYTVWMFGPVGIISRVDNVYVIFTADGSTTPEPLTSVSSYKTIQAIKETDGPDLKVDEYSISEDGTVRMLVKNVGGMDAQLDDVETNYYEFKLSNNPLIKAGETKEVFGKIDGNMDKGEPNFRLVYRSTELGCLSCKEFGISAEQTCTNDDECITGLCCAGKCREPSKGFCDDTDRDGIPDTWVSLE